MAPLNNTSRLFHRVAIIGVGLIGGSLAGAIKKGRLAGEVVGIDQDPAILDQALELDLIDWGFPEAEKGVEGAGLVVLAVPVGSIVTLASRVNPHLREGSILTDVGSVKAPLVSAIEPIMPPGRFYVGGHPIAGSERSGPEAASPDLFRGAKCILTPTERTDREALEKVKLLWEDLGSIVVTMDPYRHDQVFAAVSHLPHIVAYSLINTLLDLGEEGDKLLAYSAGGFRDYTRIAGSHPVLWRDICLENRVAILQMVARFKKALERVEEMIAAQDGEALQAEFERARAVRSGI
ncbi:MAG: prephenate dehydrogenase/arogenate dehydrogenase family protein [candidate division NC10 bacterium]|nr:prephenate dehydrogenase/arogenate dehydrogenase family protein [candidate division NC10 bacterium]